MQFTVKISTVRNGFTSLYFRHFCCENCSTLFNYQAAKITAMFSLPVAIGVVLYLQNTCTCTSKVKKECSAFFSFSDIKKARLLLKSVITTNPQHGPGLFSHYPLVFSLLLVIQVCVW